MFDGTVTRVDNVAPDGTLTTVDVDTLDQLARLAQKEDTHLRVYAVTMTVHRVWKGDIPKEITVYFLPTSEGPFFKRGMRSVVFSRESDKAMREASGMNSTNLQGKTWVHPCSGLRRDDKKYLPELGPSRKPSGA